MADDLDWNAIIAPGNDAERRKATSDREATPDVGGGSRPAAPEVRPPLSRREARAREAGAREAGARDARSPADTALDDERARASTAEPAAGNRVPPGSAAVPASREALGSDADGSSPDAEHPGDLHPDVHALLTPGAGMPSAGVDEGTHGTPAGRDDHDRPAAGAPGAAGGSGGGRGGGGRASRPPRGQRPKRRRGPLIAGLVIVAIVLAAGVGAYAFVVPKFQQITAAFTGAQEPDDYSGSGTAKVTITIKQGDIGEDVAKTLERSGVVKSSKVFYKLLLASPNVQFQPGSYALKKKMSSKAALAALQDKTNRVQASIVIPEGTALQDIEAGMVSKAGLSKAEVDAAAKNLSAYGLPAGVTTLEGWLFPATYPINPGWTATQYFKSMVDTMKEHLTAAGVAPAQQEHVIVFASLVQKEAGLAADYPKVARVFQNRLDRGMKLQSDATVAYGTGNTHTVTTTDAERADASNRFNTYVHAGLPPAPISNPGDIAIKAIVHEAPGNWLYFVTVNLQTGETVFSDTYDQHLAAVEQFQAWLRAHPSYQ
ncbi:endolytic transglycosylase MltG [Curtobacterium sp. ISL-83]|uniref:endolytic transglycosylase MltG n=1 Tax=Curtobacterium sp. ISL-83 TaxID=2819145 RepID=UPI001BE84348|nr:endolytic transglycosylase MltG [Curtobacterium sp. ISL-83]MBT2503280.1 endolytic transglycosylase MltG [Curtobacterium sp. ISL-83]